LNVFDINDFVLDSDLIFKQVALFCGPLLAEEVF